MVGLRISCIPYNGPHRPEVSYLSPTCVMQPASQRDATQHGLRSHACTQLRGQKPRTDTAVSCVFLLQDEPGDGDGQVSTLERRTSFGTSNSRRIDDKRNSNERKEYLNILEGKLREVELIERE